MQRVVPRNSSNHGKRESQFNCEGKKEIPPPRFELGISRLRLTYNHPSAKAQYLICDFSTAERSSR